MRSTRAPPKMPTRKAGRTANDPASPVWAALPVVCSTNQGSATRVSSLPIREIVVPASSARTGARSGRAGAAVGLGAATPRDAEHVVRIGRHEHIQARRVGPALEADHQGRPAVALDLPLGQEVDPAVLLPEPPLGQARGEMAHARARRRATAVAAQPDPARLAQPARLELGRHADPQAHLATAGDAGRRPASQRGSVALPSPAQRPIEGWLQTPHAAKVLPEPGRATQMRLRKRAGERCWPPSAWAVASPTSRRLGLKSPPGSASAIASTRRSPGTSRPPRRAASSGIFN